MRAERVDVTITMNNSEYSSLLALLRNFDENEEILRKFSRENNFGLGANHIDDLSQMWAKLNGMKTKNR